MASVPTFVSFRQACVRRRNANIEQGEIEPGEPITDKGFRKELQKTWQRTGTGGGMHEEGVTQERLSGGGYGKTQYWRESITLDEARATHTEPTSQGPYLKRGPVYAEGHAHPWAAGTKFWKENGQWNVAQSGPSGADVAVHIGNLARGVNVTDYILTPEGIFRMSGSSVQWIAPIDYLRTGSMR